MQHDLKSTLLEEGRIYIIVSAKSPELLVDKSCNGKLFQPQFLNSRSEFAFSDHFLSDPYRNLGNDVWMFL